MSIQIHTAQAQSHNLNWKNIWRANALINALFGDVLIFATPQVIRFMGMSDSSSMAIRLLGLACVFYAIWQFWVSRQLSRSRFLVGDAVETLVGFVCFGALVLGLEVNSAGSSALIGLGILGWLTAGLWFFASRQHLG